MSSTLLILLVAAAVLGFLAFAVVTTSLILISRRDRSRLPAGLWQPIKDLKLQECVVGSETVRYWKIEPTGVSEDAPTLVFFHGLGAWSYVWRDLVLLLATGSRLILVDLPGFGTSSKNAKSLYNLDEQSQTMALFFEQIHLDRPVLIGSSMGGAIALWMAKLNPQAYRGVIALSPAINGMRYWIPMYIPLHLVRMLAFVVNRFLFRLIMKNVIQSHHRITDEMVNEYWRPFANDPESAVTFIKGLRVVDDHRLPYELAGTSEQIPICILWGAHDQMTPVRDHRLLARYLPSAKFFTDPLSGHHVMEDAPEWCADHIRKFLAGLKS